MIIAIYILLQVLDSIIIVALIELQIRSVSVSPPSPASNSIHHLSRHVLHLHTPDVRDCNDPRAATGGKFKNPSVIAAKQHTNIQ